MQQRSGSSCVQVAAQELGIPLDRVHIAETATDKVPNTSPSAASASSDLYCMAVIDACSQLRDRLAPFRQAKAAHTADGQQESGSGAQKPPSFPEAVRAAYMAMVDLSARGFHAVTQVTGLLLGLREPSQPALSMLSRRSQVCFWAFTSPVSPRFSCRHAGHRSAFGHSQAHEVVHFTFHRFPYSPR